MSLHEAPHKPVMIDEVAQALEPGPSRLIVDGTFGAGGYTRTFLQAGASVVAFDRDPSAARFAEGLPADCFHLVQARFSELGDHVEAGSADGVTFDLGISSMQIDEADRGFSFMRDGPLDMRMGDEGSTAADYVNHEDEADLSRIFWLYGEERASRRIAKALVAQRQQKPFTRTLELAEAVERAVGGRKGAPIHPATRVFQALRIAVNDELGEVEAGLEAAERVLKVGGRLAVVTFHSLEDRIVKAFFTERAGRLPSGSRHLPPVAQGPAPTFEMLFNGARQPSHPEVAENPRARSAKLRAGSRTAAPAWRTAA